MLVYMMWSLVFYQVCAVKSPGFGDNRRANLDDIAVFTGGEVRIVETSVYVYSVIYFFKTLFCLLLFNMATVLQVISEDRGITLDKVKAEMLGTAKKVCPSSSCNAL